MISDVIQTISDRPDLQSADNFRTRSDVCDLPVLRLGCPLQPVANPSQALEDLRAARHSNHPPINWATLARLGLETVMGMDAVLPGSGVRFTVDRSY